MTEAEIQIKYGPEIKRCLIELDVEGMKKVWNHVAPHLTIHGDGSILATMHLARTQMESCPMGIKLYSQRWLNERGIGSFMDNDKRGH